MGCTSSLMPGIAIAACTCRKPRTQLSGTSTLRSKLPARAVSADLEALRTDPEGRPPAGPHLAERSPEPRGEVDVRRTRHRLALGLEDRRINDQRGVHRLVLTERLEEDAVGVDGDDRVEHVGARDPRVVGPDRFAQGPQRDPQVEPVPDHHSVEPYGAPGVRGQGQVGRVAIRVEDRRRRVIDQDDHETASGSP